MKEAVKWYGIRNGARPEVYRVFEDGTDERLKQRITYHSPDGFEFGYGGSGPSDLALNILADYVGWDGYWTLHQEPTVGTGRMLPKWVWELHNPFKFAFFADGDQRDGFTVTRDQVTLWLQEQGVSPLEA